MKNIIKKTALTTALLSTSLIFSCVGGGGGGTSATGTGTAPLTAQFIDAPVSGLDYTTSSGLSGTTDANGNFNYNPGDTITFKIGDLVVGTITMTKPEKFITPNDLVADNTADLTDAQKKINQIIAFLVGLDADGDPNNGIQIPTDVKTRLKGINIKLDEDDLIINGVKVDIDGDNVDEDLYNDFIKLYEGVAKTHYAGSLEELLFSALQYLQNKTLYLSDNPTSTCSITNIDTTNKTFSYSCQDNQGGSINETFTISNTDANGASTGLLYLVDGNNNYYTLLEVEEDEICYVDGNNIKTCLKTKDDDDNTTEIYAHDYIAPKIDKFEYAMGTDNQGNDTISTLVRKYFPTDKGYTIEVVYRFNQGNTFTDNNNNQIICGDDLVNNIYVPDCYDAVEYRVSKVSYDDYEEKYECYRGNTSWIEVNDEYEIPTHIELNKVYEEDGDTISFISLGTASDLNINTLTLYENGSMANQIDVLLAKETRNNATTYSIFVKNYGYVYETDDNQTYSLDYQSKESFFDLNISGYFLILYKDAGNYLYGELNQGDYNADLNRLDTLIGSLQFPTDATTNCQGLTNYGQVQ